MIIRLFALQTWIRKLLTPCVKETFYFCPSLSGEMLFFPHAGAGVLNIAKLPIKKKPKKPSPHVLHEDGLFAHFQQINSGLSVPVLIKLIRHNYKSKRYRCTCQKKPYNFFYLQHQIECSYEALIQHLFPIKICSRQVTVIPVLVSYDNIWSLIELYHEMVMKGNNFMHLSENSTWKSKFD